MADAAAGLDGSMSGGAHNVYQGLPVTGLPARASKVDDGVAEEALRLAARGYSQRAIARRLHLHRLTVKRVLARLTRAATIGQNVEEERQKSLATYRELMLTGWEAAEAAMAEGASPARLLGEVRQAQGCVDRLLGLAPADAGDPMILLGQLRATVLSLVMEEAPELAEPLSARLRTLAGANGTHP